MNLSDFNFFVILSENFEKMQTITVAKKSFKNYSNSEKQTIMLQLKFCNSLQIFLQKKHQSSKYCTGKGVSRRMK